MIILKPRLSEKSYQLSQVQTYVFDVPVTANKSQVASAVASQFKVKVVAVNSARRRGKAKRSVRKRSQPLTGQEKTTKRVYVKLTSGDKIAMFEEA